MNNLSRQRWLLALMSLMAWTAVASACNVPVFRYALERWRPDPYEFIVFHRGPLAGPELKLINDLEARVESEKAPANVLVTRVDLDREKDPNLLAIFKAQKSPVLPWLVARYPVHSDIREDLWAGKFEDGPALGLLDSPARREVARRIQAGESAVWVLLESGDAKKDAAVAALLQAQAAELPKKLKLPVLADEPSNELPRLDDLRIAFSFLRLSRTDPAEQMFIRMLLGTEPDLAASKEPMVFPIFGRGRTLFALVGAGITRENLLEDAAFLIGPCSCEVKRMNPGVDLLLAADWDSSIKDPRVKNGDAPELTGLGKFLEIQQAKPKPESPPKDGKPSTPDKK